MPLRRMQVTIELDGRERVLRYDLNALCLFEEETKTSLGDALRRLTMSSLRALLWAGMIHEDPMLTIQDVGRMEYPDLQTIMQKVVTAIGADSGSPASRPTNAPETPTAASTGTASGASEDMISVSATANSGA